tara:strand:- start:103 stop:345 length:243 start_codon:yes stop_codon:yes gene_type:complete
MSYIVFLKNNCPYCVETINLLNSKGLNYQTISLDQAPANVLADIKSAYEWSTVPIVFSKQGKETNLIGGYTDLKKELASE